jgi:hypothetical protein
MYVSLRIKNKIKQTLHGINTKISMTVPRNVSQACHEQSRPFPSPDDAESSGFTVDARQNHGVRRRNQSHPLARDDGAVNNDGHGNRNKTGFISGENPFLPGGP